MPLVVDSKVLERLTSPDNLCNILAGFAEGGFEIKKKTHVSQGKIPESVKLAAGIAAKEDGTASAAAVFDISQRTVRDAKAGRLHSGHDHTYTDEEFKNRVNSGEALEQSIKDAALNKMFECVQTLDVSELKSKDKAEVMARLSVVAKNLSKESGPRTAKIVIISPGVRAMAEYDTIDVN